MDGRIHEGNKGNFSPSPSHFFPLWRCQNITTVCNRWDHLTIQLFMSQISRNEWLLSTAPFGTFGSWDVFPTRNWTKGQISGQGEEQNPAPASDSEGIYWRPRWWGSRSHLAVHGPKIKGCWTPAPAVHWGNTNRTGMVVVVVVGVVGVSYRRRERSAEGRPVDCNQRFLPHKEVIQFQFYFRGLGPDKPL